MVALALASLLSAAAPPLLPLLLVAPLLLAAPESPVAAPPAAPEAFVALREVDPAALDGRFVAVRGRIRLVGAGRDLRYVVTTADHIDVHLDVARDEHPKLSPLQGRPAECRGTFEARLVRYPNPAYDRVDRHLHPVEILPVLPPDDPAGGR